MRITMYSGTERVKDESKLDSVGSVELCTEIDNIKQLLIYRLSNLLIPLSINNTLQ